MEVILREDIDKLGVLARSSKVPPATPAIICCPRNWRCRQPGQQKGRRAGAAGAPAPEAKEKSSAQDLSGMLTGVTVTFAQKAGEQEQLFGSVTSKDIAEALERQGYTRPAEDPSDEPIKQLGEYKVPIRLHREVTTEILVRVVPEEA